jgi:hypothetical protein
MGALATVCMLSAASKGRLNMTLQACNLSLSPVTLKVTNDLHLIMIPRGYNLTYDNY